MRRRLTRHFSRLEALVRWYKGPVPLIRMCYEESIECSAQPRASTNSTVVFRNRRLLVT
jgi:hypothetical protein